VALDTIRISCRLQQWCGPERLAEFRELSGYRWIAAANVPRCVDSNRACIKFAQYLFQRCLIHFALPYVYLLNNLLNTTQALSGPFARNHGGSDAQAGPFWASAAAAFSSLLKVMIGTASRKMPVTGSDNV
jgi:hypothetical protein